MRGEDQGGYERNEPLYALRTGMFVGHMRILWKTGEKDGLLGKGLLIYEGSKERSSVCCNKLTRI